MKVAIVGDVHLTLRKYKEFEENRFKLLINELIAAKPHIVIFAGDLLDHARPTLEEIELMYYGIDKLKASSIKVQIISGNHEIMNIMDPNDPTYTSDKNLPHNKKYFSQTTFINEYIANSYAWIKLNDIMIAHGGLCSDYLKFLDESDEPGIFELDEL